MSRAVGAGVTTFLPGALRGRISLAGDKSISHRALLLASVAHGTTRIGGLNDGEDVRATRDALQTMGADIVEDGSTLVVRGVALSDPPATVDAHNSGTTARLLAGLAAGCGLRLRIDGDDSLRNRPMERVARPLRAMGATVTTTSGRLPMEVAGPRESAGDSEYALDIPSAQVKSAILLANLRSQKPIAVTGDRGSRDHTERLLRHFGRAISFDAQRIDLEPGRLRANDVRIPCDLSAAAYFLVGASVAPGSAVTLQNVGVNPTRTGILDVLRAMGADIALDLARAYGEEPVANLRVRSAPLVATTVSGDLTVRTIDELVVIAVAAAFAAGRTEIRDASELRTKESDRIAGIVRLLRACAIEVAEFADGIAIMGGTPLAPRSPITTGGDHRIAMAAAILGAATGPLVIDDGACIAVSFPEFESLWRAAQRPSE